MKKILVLVCAKKNSSEIPNKNLIKFRGKTIVEHSIAQALKLKRKYNIKVICSTDSKKIANLAKKRGALVPFLRPKKLATKNSKEWMVWKHALLYLKKKENYSPDIFLSLSPTAPLRKINDILKSINIFLKSKKDIIVTVHKSKVNPYFNMIERKKNGNYSLCKINKTHIFNRQSSPKVFSMNTVAYVAKPSFIKNKNNIFDGKVGICETNTENSLDLDTMDDLRYLKTFENDKHHKIN